MTKKVFRTNIILVFIVVIIAIVPLIMQKGAEFSGSDDKAECVITVINADYKPWFSPIWEPPSGEIESLFFSLQAAIGAGIIGYYFGKTSKKNEE